MKAIFKEPFKQLGKDEDKKLLFLKYLYKNLQDSVGNIHGKGHYLDEDRREHFVSIDEMLVNLPNGINVPVKFTTNWINNKPRDIEVSADLETSDWGILVEFLNETMINSLSMALAQKKEKYFFRACFGYIGPPLEGAYYIKGRSIRISPATQGEAKFNGENFIYLDMNTEGIEKGDARLKSRVAAKEITSILSVILNTGFYEPSRAEHRWVRLPNGEHGCFQLDFPREQVPESMTEKDIKKAEVYSGENLKEFIRKDQETLRLPLIIRKLINAYYNLDVKEKAAFIGAARMYQMSLLAGRISPTVKATYQLSALDALSKPERKNSENKNAIISLVDNYYSKGIGEDIGKLYGKIRNAHFHQGYFDKYELSGVEFRPFFGPDWINQEIDDLLRSHVVFYTLNNWLYEKIERKH